jgi:hypothetical protein
LEKKNGFAKEDVAMPIMKIAASARIRVAITALGSSPARLPDPCIPM